MQAENVAVESRAAGMRLRSGWSRWLLAGAICGVIGILAGILAPLAGLWRYTEPWKMVAELLVVYVGVMGALSAATADRVTAWQFAAGFVGGLVYELINATGWHAFFFPNDRLLVAEGFWPSILVASLLWGLMVLVVASAVTPRASRGAPA